jgi:hypothetical protein
MGNADVQSSMGTGVGARDRDPCEGIVDACQFDVPYFLSIAFDNYLRVEFWYAAG